MCKLALIRILCSPFDYRKPNGRWHRNTQITRNSGSGLIKMMVVAIRSQNVYLAKVFCFCTVGLFTQVMQFLVLFLTPGYIYIFQTPTPQLPAHTDIFTICRSLYPGDEVVCSLSDSGLYLYNVFQTPLPPDTHTHTRTHAYMCQFNCC